MGVLRSLPPERQIESLYQAVQRLLDSAKALGVQFTLADEFGLRRPSVSEALADELQLASESLATVGHDLLRRTWETEKIPENISRYLVEPSYRIQRFTWRRQPDEDVRNVASVAVSGVLAHRQPELRLLLRDLTTLRSVGALDDWRTFVQSEIARAFLLLVRKQDGRRDIEAGLAAISSLRSRQADAEPLFLKSLGDGIDAPLGSVASLIALYNVARAVELTGQFLAGARSPKLTVQGLLGEIDRFILNAADTVRWIDPELLAWSARIGAACKELVSASVYAIPVPRSVRQFLDDLATSGDADELLELWYAQRKAIDSRLLDPTRTAIVVSMPTSAGKTLLAEMAIAQALEEAPESTVAYLAPTRALVTQVCLRLRRDFARRKYTVRIATPAFELDPVEDELLKERIHILVTTPEKLDLLVRTDHVAVRALSLVVVDEAHNLGDKTRGARLELLLASLRRERPGVRFLLLSPFARNAAALSQWLAGNSGAAIVVDWSPNDRVVGYVTAGKKVRGRDERPLTFTTLRSVHSDCPPGVGVDLGTVRADSQTKETLAVETAITWAGARRGAVLVLAPSRPTAEARASTIAVRLQRAADSRAIRTICDYLDAEIGGRHPLSDLLERGVAFHHAGLSSEARYFVERLVEQNLVQVLCATTTLAQGVNFPLSVAVIESYHHSYNSAGSWYRLPMKGPEFWNLAGRVGRTFKEALGVIAFVGPRATDPVAFQNYMDDDTNTVSSALYDFIKLVRGRDVTFGSRLVESVPAASAFLQYLVHAIAVATVDVVRGDVEGLLRSSFVYQQARAEDPSLADELVRLARRYLDELVGRKGKAVAGFAKMADGTGFSSPSIDLMWRDWRGTDSIPTDLTDWTHDALFPPGGEPSDVLTRIIETLHSVPEIRLGSEDEGDFSASRIARITTAWVNGVSLHDLAEREYGGDVLRCAHHVYTSIVNLVPWGLRGVQQVLFSGRDDVSWDELNLLPGMVFHGVHSREAIALRMLSIPRIVAEALASRYREEGRASLTEVPSWVGALDEAAWAGALPGGTRLTGAQCRDLWQILDGQRSWADVFPAAQG